MSFREYIQKLENKKEITKIKKEVSKKLETSGIIHNAGFEPIYFENIKESKFAVAANIFPTKKHVAEAFECTTSELIPKMIKAIENPTKPEIIKKGECFEEELEVDLDKLPILFHCEKDGGNYISSGVIIAKDSEHGQNMSFHRCMQLDKTKFSVRILQRHLNEFIEKNNGKLEIAMCVGNSPQVLLAGAISTNIGVNELEIANSLKPFKVSETSNGILIPSDTEFVLEGILTNDLETEGPFVDLTETYDIVRKQRIFEVKRIRHRKKATWHGLLPGGFEHKILMGMPKEPTIFQEVNKVVKCLDVNINPGGCSWLHAIIKIKKQKKEDSTKAIEAAFTGHKSLKHCFIVDEDIDIYNPEEVEWAMATRFQADKGIILKENQKGSSLDPSANPETRKTAKAGFDLTIQKLNKKEDFTKAKFPKFKLKDYLEE